MNALGKYCHDFPRLAKESGFKFQLCRGKVNWSELDNLNIEEIVDEKNFHLLEENLIHVINFNVETDYDVRILDPNFVKLFKLAQLGIDYLSYCELYLDRCVILMQEQLSSYQEECLLLKEENAKNIEEIKRARKKNKLHWQNYKCDKCEKVFMNETYLESHYMRRHRQKAAEENETRAILHTDQAQQTDAISNSVCTQTVNLKSYSENSEILLNDSSDTVKVREQELKIDQLKKDLDELKIRLDLAEKLMEDKKNDEKNNLKQSCSFPSAVIPIIHSYISPASNSCVHVNPNSQSMVHGVTNQFIVHDNLTADNLGTSTVSQLAYETPLKNNSADTTVKSVDYPISSKCETPALIKTLEVSKAVGTKSLDCCDADDLKVSCQNEIERQTEPQNKILNQLISGNCLGSNDLKTTEMCSEIQNVPTYASLPPSVSVNDLKLECDSLNGSCQSLISSPITIWQAKKSEDAFSQRVDSSAHVNKDLATNVPVTMCDNKNKVRDIHAEEFMLKSEEANIIEQPKSLFKHLISKKSPKIQKLTVNLKTSLSQLYDAVSLSGKKSTEVQAMEVPFHSESDITQGLNSRLRRLGIDPEWEGIPKDTMKQKLSILEHQRNVISKENRLYPFLRKKIDKHIIKKLKTNSILYKDKSDTSQEQIMLKREQKVISDLPGSTSVQNYESNENSDSHMINGSEGKVGSKSSGSLNTEAKFEKTECRGEIKEENLVESNDGGEEGNETDFTIFQATKFKQNISKGMESQLEPRGSKLPDTIDELHTDSDFDDEFVEEFNQQSVHSINRHITSDSTIRRETIGSFPENDYENKENSKQANQSILKIESIDNNSSSKYQPQNKKRVLFSEQPQICEGIRTQNGLTNTLDTSKLFNYGDVYMEKDDDDDNWSIESEWNVNVGQAHFATATF